MSSEQQYAAAIELEITAAPDLSDLLGPSPSHSLTEGSNIASDAVFQDDEHDSTSDQDLPPPKPYYFDQTPKNISLSKTFLPNLFCDEDFSSIETRFFEKTCSRSYHNISIGTRFLCASGESRAQSCKASARVAEFESLLKDI